MKILQVNKLYPPAVGGIEKTVGLLASGLSAQHTVRVLAIREGFGFGSLRQEGNIWVRRCGGFGKIARMPVSLSFFWYFFRESKQADVIHVHYPFPLAAFALWLFRPKADIFITWHSSVVRQKFLGKLVKPFVDWSLNAARGIITTFPRASSFYSELENFGNKTRAIPLSFDGAAALEKRHDQKNSLTYIHVGRLVYYKGLDTVLRAFARMSEGKLVIVGDGPLFDDLKNLSVELGADNRVDFLPDASDQQVSDLMKQADVFVLGSDHESEVFGMVQLEAMAAGLPIINTNLPTGVPWVARHNEHALTVEPADIGALAAAMKQMADSAPLRQRLSDEGRRRAGEFSIERMIQAHHDMYRGAIE